MAGPAHGTGHAKGAHPIHIHPVSFPRPTIYNQASAKLMSQGSTTIPIFCNHARRLDVVLCRRHYYTATSFL
jgi:uncharacterized protein (UPF0262 family)